MFSLIADGLQAYNQVGLLCGALICLGIGGLLFGYSLYERTHAFRAVGTIIGVMSSNGMFCPVYRYTAPDGQTHVAKSQATSNWARGKETGRVVPLIISSRNPARVREANSYFLDILGLVLFACGLGLGYIVLAAYPITLMTWIMAFALVVFLVERGYRIVRKGNPAFVQRKQREAIPIDLADVKPIEQILAGADHRQTQFHNVKLAVPVLVVLAVILACAGTYQGMKLSRLEATGLRAPGEVVRLQRDGAGDDVYYAFVRFRTENKRTIEFKDSVGGNPPSYRRGDKVTVLYLADNPREAMIDRGFWGNWAIPVLLFLGAALMVGLLVLMLRNGTLQKTPIPQPSV